MNRFQTLQQEPFPFRVMDGENDTCEVAAVSRLDAEPDLDAGCSLETVLAAWHEATVRLEQTHELLQAEVHRLNVELEAKNRQLALQNRLTDLGRMASHVAHEVRNSLVPVTLYMELLKRRLAEDADSLTVLAKLEAGFTALDVTVNDLLNFTSHREPRWQLFSASQLIAEVCEALGPQLEAQAIAVQTEIDPGLQLCGDREMLRRAVLNLALNALDAMTTGGEMMFTVLAGQGGHLIEVADSGQGITPGFLRKVFEPFYTTKSQGTGLGLAIVHRIAEAHGGRVTASNCSEGGAAFTIELPYRQVQRVAA
jgi:signal transduction histidine kinase